MRLRLTHSLHSRQSLHAPLCLCTEVSLCGLVLARLLTDTVRAKKIRVIRKVDMLRLPTGIHTDT
jgi:hypothetical protein